VFEEGAAPLAERLRVHNRMRIGPVGLRRDLLRVEPGALVLVGVLPTFSRVVPANNYASSLRDLRRFEEVKAQLSKVIPVARRALGEGNTTTLMMRWNYAQSLYRDDVATLDDLREAVTTLEDTARIARRVLGGAHPITAVIEDSLRNAQETHSARETPSPEGSA